MTNLADLKKHFKLLTDPSGYSSEEQKLLERFLSDEYALREQKKRAQLLRMSGIRGVRLLSDFDWSFNPKIPRGKVVEFIETQWLKTPSNLILIGPSGVGNYAK